MERLKADEEAGSRRPELEFPPLVAADHLIGYLFSVGPTAGGEPLTFQEIRAWVDLTGHSLSPWEAETLRTLSAAYASEHFQASDPDRPAPYRSTPFQAIKPSRDDVGARLTAAFDLLERQDAGKA
jgi:hypothetical protein